MNCGDPCFRCRPGRNWLQAVPHPGAVSLPGWLISIVLIVSERNKISSEQSPPSISRILPNCTGAAMTVSCQEFNHGKNTDVCPMVSRAILHWYEAARAAHSEKADAFPTRCGNR